MIERNVSKDPGPRSRRWQCEISSSLPRRPLQPQQSIRWKKVDAEADAGADSSTARPTMQGMAQSRWNSLPVNGFDDDPAPHCKAYLAPQRPDRQESKRTFDLADLQESRHLGRMLSHHSICSLESSFSDLTCTSEHSEDFVDQSVSLNSFKSTLADGTVRVRARGLLFGSHSLVDIEIPHPMLNMEKMKSGTAHFPFDITSSSSEKSISTKDLSNISSERIDDDEVPSVLPRFKKPNVSSMVLDPKFLSRPRAIFENIDDSTMLHTWASMA